MTQPKQVKPEDLTLDEIRGLLGLFNDEGSLVIVRGEDLLEVQKADLRDWLTKSENKELL
jgi:hypothetical protein